MTVNPYYDPQDLDLEIVGQIEDPKASWSFDSFIVWRNRTTGFLYFASDAGCSCPVPFDGFGYDKLTMVTRSQDLIDGVAKYRESLTECWDEEYDAGYVSALDGKIGSLIQKAREMATYPDRRVVW